MAKKTKVETVKVTIPTPSEANSLNGVDYKKIGKGAIIAFGGAILLSVGEWLTTGNVELWKPALTAALGVGINAAWKFLQSPPKL